MMNKKISDKWRQRGTKETRETAETSKIAQLGQKEKIQLYLKN